MLDAPFKLYINYMVYIENIVYSHSIGFDDFWLLIPAFVHKHSNKVAKMQGFFSLF